MSAMTRMVSALADGLHTPINPAVQGSGIAWSDVGVLALWAGVGLIVALRRFSWVPATRA